MNGRIRWMSALMAVALVPWIFAGCASTPTRESTGQYIDDSAITAKVKAACARDHVVKATEVNVETYKGVVQLSGFVDSEHAKKRAAMLAQDVKGVVRVENNIIIKPLDSAMPGIQGKMEEYEGDVSALDAEKATVTIKKALISHTFELGPGAQIIVREKNHATIGDLHVGDHVKVTYSGEGGLNKVVKIEQFAQK